MQLLSSRRLSAALAIIVLVGGVYLLLDSRRAPSVTIAWETGSEQDTAGFNILRRPYGAEDASIQQINDTMIAARGSELVGASYAFVDDSVRRGERYEYQIDEVVATGLVKRLPDTIEATVEDGRQLLEALALIGLSGLILGLDRRSNASRAKRDQAEAS